MRISIRGVSALSIGVAALLLVSRVSAQEGAKNGEWRHYGGDLGSTKYSPLDQITPENVNHLKVAWTWESPDADVQKENRALRPYTFENTPLMVGGKLYVSTSLSQLVAVDAKTGKTIWTFNPEAYKVARPTNMGYVHRGVAYWADGDDERIYLASHEANLWAIDAKTGKPVSTFGDEGRVDLTKAIPLARRASNFTMTSPPVICRNTVVVGSSIADVPQNKEAPRGDIQGFDVRTGKPSWIFHTIPQAGEVGNDTWENEAWKFTGNANAWPPLSADEELGYVYIPTGTPTNDWYGGHRLGDNLFAESLVCLDATTGKRVWHFQTVHHGLWDYDLPAAPVLCNIKVDGKEIKAVAQPAKTGFLWVFDRATGKPVWPIDERPVAASKVVGERAASTQPFPTKPLPFERQGSTEDNLIDFTPEMRAAAKETLEKWDHGPLFTPPTERGLIQLPGWGGGADWWGASFDVETGMMYVPSVTSPIIVKLAKPDSARSNMQFIRGMGGNMDGPHGLPLFKPPYARVTAIDMNTGDHAWMVPHGDGPREKVSELVGHDVGPLGGGIGGPLLTKRLLFVGQGANNLAGRDALSAVPALRVYAKTTGQLVGILNLPFRPSGTPMTYLVDGKQHVVIATADGKLVALALPAENG